MLQTGIHSVTNWHERERGNRATLNIVSPLSRFPLLFVSFLLLLPGSGAVRARQHVHAKRRSPRPRPPAKSSTAHKSEHERRTRKRRPAAFEPSPRKKVDGGARPPDEAHLCCLQRPAARWRGSLVEFRTPAAYAGVENYAHAHANTEAGALAWFAIGYAHYLDAQYPAAIAALQKAQPYIGELKDYTSFFIGNSYVQSNSPESSVHVSARFWHAVSRFALCARCHHRLRQGVAGHQSPGRSRSICWRSTARRPAPRPNIFSARLTCRTARDAPARRSCATCTTTIRPVIPPTTLPPI